MTELRRDNLPSASLAAPVCLKRRTARQRQGTSAFVRPGGGLNPTKLHRLFGFIYEQQGSPAVGTLCREYTGSFSPFPS